MRSIPILAVAAVLIAGQASAVDLRFLKDTPASRFDKEDARLFQAALDKALNDSAVDAPVGWSNPKTGGQGTITPVKTYQAGAGERTCRDMRVASSHSGLKAEGLYKFCQSANGQWSLRSP